MPWGAWGAEVIKAVVGAEDCSLVGAIDNTPGKEGADVGLELGLGELEVAVTADFRRLSLRCEPIGAGQRQRRCVGGFHPPLRCL